LVLLGLFVISSYKRQINPPGERNEDPVTWKSLMFFLMCVFFLWTPDTTNENAQLLQLLTGSTALCCPMHYIPWQLILNKAGWSWILCQGIHLRSCGLNWTCSYKWIFSGLLWELWTDWSSLSQKLAFYLFYVSSVTKHILYM
jgi:hypothetical protein